MDRSDADTDLCRLSHHLRHLGAQLVPSGAQVAEAGGGDVCFGLGGGIEQLVELQDLLLDGVEAAQPLPALHLPLALQLRLPQTLLLRLPQPQVEDLMHRMRRNFHGQVLSQNTKKYLCQCLTNI